MSPTIVKFLLLCIVFECIKSDSFENNSNMQASFNVPQTCSLSINRNSGVQLIQPQPGFREPFEVFCDQEYEGGGWIVIQNRYDGSVHFYRDWDEYERGFGSFNGEFWLGLSKIHELTYSLRYELHIVLEDWDGIRAIARYSDFLVAGPKEKYLLRSLGSFNGSAGDSLTDCLGMMFTTFDEDNDLWDSNCAIFHYGAWWYNRCSYIPTESKSSLNGKYLDMLNLQTMFWNTFRVFSGFRKSRMMIRVVD